MAKANEELLNELHRLVTQDLIDKIASGNATAQELQAAIKLLKDNKIEVEREKHDPIDILTGMMKSFPQFDDEYETQE
jgi:hypothetical protein